MMPLLLLLLIAVLDIQVEELYALSLLVVVIRVVIVIPGRCPGIIEGWWPWGRLPRYPLLHWLEYGA